MTVPALPTSTRTAAPGGDAGGDGDVRSGLVDGSSRGRAAPPMASEVSRAFRRPRTTDGESLSAARMSARLVIDFEPGSRSVARTGPCAAGARQRPESITLRVSADGVRGWGRGRGFAGARFLVKSSNPACTGL